MVSATAERALRAPAPEHEGAHGGPTAYRLLPWSGLALFVAVLVAVGPAEIFPDTWFALDGARELLQHGIGDRNTWTRYGSHEWVNQQWAAHLGFYAAWRIGGAIGLATPWVSFHDLAVSRKVARDDAPE